jgi:hypothetical protein
MINTDTIQVTQELLALLSELDEFNGAWRALSKIAVNATVDEIPGLQREAQLRAEISR